MRPPKDQTRDRAAALIGFAIIAPVLFLLVIGGLILGLATVDNLRVERAASDGALRSEAEARQLIEEVGGILVCYSEKGECFDDGFEFDRIQIIAQGRTWHYPTGSITPIARVSRPKETTDDGEIVDE